MSDRNIYQRIHAVMEKVKYVQKDATVQGYKAVTHDQVVATARQALVDEGIVIYPEQTASGFERIEGSKMSLYNGWYRIHFVNMDKPEDRVTVTVEAHAADNSDKAPGKCATYAVKTATLKVLFLETGENDESRTAVPDITGEIETIRAAATQEALKKAFAAAWTTHTGKDQRAALTQAKDAQKAKLNGGDNATH